MKKKTILFSGNTLWSMYNFRRALFADFVKNNYRVVVVAPEDDFKVKIEEMGCEFIPINMSAKGVNPLADFFVFMAYLKILKKVKPDFCFFYTIKPNIYGCFAAKFLEIKHIAVTTGLGYIFINKGIISSIAKKLYKKAFKKVQQVWFLNQDDYSEFIKENIIPQSKGSVMKGGEGIDLTNFDVSAQPDNVSFLLMARMLWDKGVGIYADAARNLKREYPNVQFNLLGFIGVDNPSAISKEQIESWEKEGIINYLSVTNDVRPFIANSSCVVLPSYYREGVPFSLLEGAAMAKPLIATNSVGCKETIDDKITGFFCEIKDVQSLQTAMRNIISMNKDDRQKMGLAGRRKIENEFDVKNTIEKYYQAVNA